MFTKRIVVSSLLLAAGSAQASGLASCDSGPKESWQPQARLESTLKSQGWEIRRIKVDGGCYEVYATDAKGARIEAYFHPVTLAPVPASNP